MADRDAITGFCNELLDIDAFEDYGPNGIQVPGSPEVSKVITGVSAHRELLERAVDAGGDLLLTHHGLFWDFHPRALSPQMAQRLRIALDADLTVAGYHLPLDAHPEIGNNALLCEGLGFSRRGDRFAEVRGREIGIIGEHPDGIPVSELGERVNRLLGREPLIQGDGPDLIRTIGVVTGAAAGEIDEAISLGFDAFITGEPSEHAMADANEGGIHFIAAGHYATETLGIRRLGELIAEKFGIEHDFIEIPNPV